MVCMTPPMPKHKNSEGQPSEVPFSIALTQDEFEPFTETHHRFRYYTVPRISEIHPTEVEVGFITEITVLIDPKKLGRKLADTKAPANLFFEPMPSELGMFDLQKEMGDESSLQASALLKGNTIKCKFGRFGETVAVYVNQTMIKCLTPSLLENPEDIYRETVQFSVSMNGYDYIYEINSFDFTFIGTADWISLGPIIMTIILAGLVVAAFIYFVQNYHSTLPPSGPYTDDQQPRIRVRNSVHSNPNDGRNSLIYSQQQRNYNQSI